MQEIEETSASGIVAVVAETSLAQWAVSFIPYIAVLLGMYLLHNVWIAALAYHLGAAAVLYRTRFDAGDPHTTRGGSAIVVGINLLIGIFTGVLLYSLWPMLGTPADLGARLARMGLTSWTVFGIYYCAVNPLLEELLWRRFMPNRSISPTWHDALFAGYHMLVLAIFMQWQWMAVSFVLLMSASCIWRFSIRRPNGLLIVSASHFLADLGIVLVGCMKTSHF